MKDPTKITHCILYSIKTSANPLDEKEIKFLRDFTNDPNINNTPIIIVIIEHDRTGNTKKMIRNVKQLNLKVFDIVPVIVKKKMFLLPFKYHYGIEDLYYTILKSTSDVLIENNYEFHNKTLKYKRIKAYSAISIGALAASGFGYKKMSISKFKIYDYILLAMIKCIQKSYGVNPPANFIDLYVNISKGSKLAQMSDMAYRICNNIYQGSFNLDDFKNLSSYSLKILKNISSSPIETLKNLSSTSNEVQVKNQTESFFSWSSLVNYFTAGPVCAAISGIATATVGTVYATLMERTYKDNLDLNITYTQLEKLVDPLFEEKFLKNVVDWLINYFYK